MTVYCIKDWAGKIRKPVFVKKGVRWRRRQEKRDYMSVFIESVPSSEINVQPSSKRCRCLVKRWEDHAVMTPTTMAAKAPMALNAFLDPPLPLLLPLEVFEGLEPVEEPLGVPVLEPPDLGVAEESG